MFDTLTAQERMTLSVKLRGAYDYLMSGNYQATEWQRQAYATAIEIARVRGDIHANH